MSSPLISLYHQRATPLPDWTAASCMLILRQKGNGDDDCATDLPQEAEKV